MDEEKDTDKDESSQGKEGTQNKGTFDFQKTAEEMANSMKEGLKYENENWQEIDRDYNERANSIPEAMKLGKENKSRGGSSKEGSDQPKGR